jgi:hypothetical protein
MESRVRLPARSSLLWIVVRGENTDRGELRSLVSYKQGKYSESGEDRRSIGQELSLLGLVFRLVGIRTGYCAL